MTMEPLGDRIGHVGGIESLVVDGRRWHFGFDYRSDLVLSPLIEDGAAMATFASEHMLQVDGQHDPAYWLELVEMSVETTELGDDADRHIDLEDVARQMTLPYYLRYLLAAAGGWEDSLFTETAIQTALNTIGVPYGDRGWDCVEAVEAALDDPGPAQQAAQLFLRRYTEFLLDRAPANWPEVFSTLRP